MSYEDDGKGNKVFYEQGLKDENEPVPLNFDSWYGVHSVKLQERYIDDNPEDFVTDESMQEVTNNSGFQSFCECEYDDYSEDFK